MTQLSKETFDVLKNFASINNSVCFKKGSVQKTVSPQKTILVQATFKEEFPQDFAIYDLSQFLSVLSLLDSPVLSFSEKSVTLKSDKSKVVYYFASPENIASPKDKKVVLPSIDATFVLDAAAMKAAIQAAGVLSLPEIYVAGRDGTAYVGSGDSRTQTSNTFEYPAGPTESEFHMIFKLDNIKVMQKTYTVELCNKGIAHFTSEDKSLEYWIPVDANANKNK